MKKIFLLFLPFLMIFFQCFSSNKNLEKVNETTISHPATFVAFNNENFGITVGEEGQSYYTNNGSKSWQKAEFVDNVQCRFNFDVINDKVAVSTGNGGVILTVDGGKIWEKINPIRWDLISFVDQKSGWLANDTGKLLMTEDSGSTWKEISVYDKNTQFSAINLITSEQGYILNADGMLYFTKNKGKSWNINNINKKKYKLSLDQTTTAMRFVNKDNGFIITKSKNQKKGWVFLITADGGKNWKVEYFQAPFGKLFLSKDCKYITLTSSFTSLPIKAVVYKNPYL